jgi:hypothetical protein
MVQDQVQVVVQDNYLIISSRCKRCKQVHRCQCTLFSRQSWMHTPYAAAPRMAGELQF